MNNIDLKKYLKIVVDMEESIQLQKAICLQLKKRIDLPTRINDVPKPVPPHDESSDIGNNSVPFIASAVVLCVLGILLVFSPPLDFLGYISFLAALFFVIVASMEAKQRQEKIESAKSIYYQKLSQYNQQMRDYNKRIQLENIRISKETSKKKAMKYQLERLEEQIVKSQNVLKTIYSPNIIFPKYQNYVMVCSLYEYLVSGRCNSLDGHDGAYNILELEIRMDRIILQLGEIASHLERIKANQYQLYQSLQHTNRMINSLIFSADQIASSICKLQDSVDTQEGKLQEKLQDLYDSSELGNYCANRIQKELHYLNQMKYFRGENSGVFNNIPPN